MNKNPLLDLQRLGQSIWLDYLRRGMIVSGELDELIENDGLRGMTSNPAIFEKAISGSHDYDRDVRSLALEDLPPQKIYERLAVKDIQMAADKFRPLYDQSDGQHGFVSLEVNPHLARDTQGTIEEARRLWREVDRPNVMIKVPATEEGLPAIQQLTREGINVNITLLFGLPRYQKVAWAYIHGLEERAAQGEPLDRIASVASFFLSRIDVLVDPQLEKIEKKAGQQAELASRLHGKVALSSAKVAYQLYQQIFNSQSFQQLRKKGARTQRLLWASTSTKNPAYSDIKYVQHLIGAETINTVPTETLVAFRDHGKAESTLEQGVEDAQEVLENLNDLGIDIDEVTQQLEDEGIEKFVHPFAKLIETLQAEIAQAKKEPVDRQTLHLGTYQGAFQDRVHDLDEKRFASRLWKKDPSLWKADPEDERSIVNALGWLHVSEKMAENLSELEKTTGEIHQAGFKKVIHLGMGGSSLAPMLFARTFKPEGKGLPLTVLDTTDPATILDLTSKIPLKDTLFIVASKSGKTVETGALADFFYARLEAIKGSRAGENFVAITDPGTPLQEMAKQRAFRHTFLNFTDIGGRYSALSYFGLLPAVLLGMDVNELLERSLRMLHACSSCVPAGENPGMLLGAAIGQLALQGRDKLTILTPEPVSAFGMWLEQLIAESTGKEGTGILPVAGEAIGAPEVYGPDRVFIYFRLKGEEDPAWEKRITELEAAGHPVIAIQLDDLMDLGQEFVRWEIATATAGAILGINAFNQ
ncbi:MAG: bifunctional transaldolase/phosoglucose isomerase, partial [Omnitrophica WOR_2 bacterium]